LISKRALRISLAVLLLTSFIAISLTIGTASMNYALVEFFGSEVRQPSPFAWLIFWFSVFVFRNSELNVEFERIRSWLGFSVSTNEKLLEDIKSLRQELQDSTKWLEEEINAYHVNEGPTFIGENDLG